MNNMLKPIIDRQVEISEGNCPKIDLPKKTKYTLCNLRGGIGKTTLAFNLSYLGDDVLAVDTCPQGNLSFHFDNNYYTNQTPTVRDMLLPYVIPGLFGKSSRVAKFVGATNQAFENRKTYYIPSSNELYLLPSQLTSALNLASSTSGNEEALTNILFSLKNEIQREMDENEHVTKCLIDTSPFFAGATQLAWYAADALIIPVRTDLQSIKSLELLINTLTSSQSEFRKYIPSSVNCTPKIQIVILTHCGWSTAAGSKYAPNQQTLLYLNKVYEILNRNRQLLSTDNPQNHLLMLDDFLGSGRIASAESKPIDLLKAGQQRVIDRVSTKVNKSVDKCKYQLNFINQLIW